MKIEKSEVIVFKWDYKQEDFIKLASEEANPYVSSVRSYEFDKYLGCYPHENYTHWLRLSNHLSWPFVVQCQPSANRILAHSKPLSENEYVIIKENLVNHGISSEISDNFKGSIDFNFAPISKLKIPINKSPSQITFENLDKSSFLEFLIQNHYQNNQNFILAEIQFCFIGFLFGQSIECFEQWKKIILLMLNCESSMKIVQRNVLFTNFCVLLQNQLAEVPQDFFLDIIEEKNFLHASLSGFKEIIQDEEIPINVVNSANNLCRFAEDRFGISLDPYYADDPPTIVEL